MAYQNYNNQYKNNNYNQKPAFQVEPVQYEVDGQELSITPEYVRQALVNGGGNVSDQEISMFLNLCKYQKLNPFIGDAYLIKFKSNNPKYEKPAQQITTRQAFLKRAESNPHYDGKKSGLIVERNGEMKRTDGAIKLTDDLILGAWAEVSRDDRKVQTHVEISFKEFAKKRWNQQTNQWELQSTWKEMPMYMITKVAEVNALRQTFTESLGALHTEDEVQTQVQSNTEAKANDKPRKVSDLVGNHQHQKQASKNESKEQSNSPQSNAAQYASNSSSKSESSNYAKEEGEVDGSEQESLDLKYPDAK